MAVTVDGQYQLSIILPGDLSRDDEDKLRKCIGSILFVPTLRKRVPLRDVSVRSFHSHGRPADYTAMLYAYRTRFPVLVTGASRSELQATALTVGYPRGLMLRNNNPYDLSNGDLICLLPPLPGLAMPRVTLPSCGVELEFPMTLPAEAARDLMGRIISGMAYEFCVRSQIPAARPADAYRSSYRGRTIDLTPALRDGAALRDLMHTLFTSLMFSMHEGMMVVLALMPTLLVGGATDPFINSLVQMRSATRLSVQLLRPPEANLPDPGRVAARNNVFDMLGNWLAAASQLSDALSLKPMLKVCMYHANSSTIKEGDTFSAIVP